MEKIGKVMAVCISERRGTEKKNIHECEVVEGFGLKNDALLHISEISNKFVDDPSKVLSVGQIIKVRIKDIDKERERVALTKKEK